MFSNLRIEAFAEDRMVITITSPPMEDVDNASKKKRQ
jgi:hypothetical protein